MQRAEATVSDLKGADSMDDVSVVDFGAHDIVGEWEDATATLPPLVLNEVRCADSDFVELFNLSLDEDVILDGWRISDGDEADHQYALDGRSIGPRGWLLVPRANPGNGVAGFPFGLGCGSDTVRLHAPGGQVVDSVELPEMAIDLTWGRLPDGTGVWQVNGATPGSGNLPPVDIEEVLYSQDRVVYLDFTVSDQGIQSLGANPYDWVEGTFELESEDYIASPMQVGVRLKGRYGSFQPIEGKASFKVAFNFVDPIGRFLGLKRMTLNSMVSDPAMVDETVSYRLFREFGLPAPRTGHAWVRVNGEDFGLYVLIESFDDTWLARNFETTGHLYEGGYGSDLTPGDEVFFEVDEGDEGDIHDLVSLIQALTSSTVDQFVDQLEGYVDLPGFTRLVAMEHFTGHWDGYSVVMNNFYIHFDETGFATFVPWGTDQVFKQYLPFYYGKGALFRKCVASEECLNMYNQALLQMVPVVQSVAPAELAQSTADFLRPWIEADPRKPYSDQEALDGLAQVVKYINNQYDRIAEFDVCINDPDDLDLDGDGHVCDLDCEEGDPTTHVHAPEICDDVVDNDCNWLTDDGPTCPDCVPLYMGNHDYMVCLAIRKYDAAKQVCAEHGMSVVALNSAVEESWVMAVIHIYGLIESWIGLVRQQSGEFGWEDGSPLDYEAWEPGEPDGTPGYSDCVQVFTWKGWIDTSCKTTNSVMCEGPCLLSGDSDGDGFAACSEDCDDTNSAVYPGAKDAGGACTDGIDQDCNGFADDGPECPPAIWLETPEVEAAHFVFLDAKKKRDVARAHCQDLGPGADLAWFDTPEQLAAASAALQEVAPEVVVWIGLQDVEAEGVYLWADGSVPAFLNWAPGQPNNYNDAEDCCRLMPAGTFNDTGCLDSYRAMCRVPG